MPSSGTGRPEAALGPGVRLIDEVATAGAYVLLDGRFPFMIGPTRDGDRLAVVRLGGHREAGESPWQCAAREVLEESGLTIQAVAPPGTYWLAPEAGTPDHDRLMPGDWPPESPAVHAPIFIVRGTATQADRLSIMYLARAEGRPEPLNEARGLLLLAPAEIFALVSRPITLAQHLRAGGCAILHDGLPHDLPLFPHLQLQILAALLRRHPDLTR
jgi:8-oxo-dGTP pyrophosphatase MutT (NUDIX family)